MHYPIRSIKIEELGNFKTQLIIKLNQTSL